MPDFPLRSDSFLSHVDMEVDLIFRAISSLSDKLSLSPDLIPFYSLKRTSVAISYSLKLILERSISTSWLPSFWKTTIVVPLLKKPPSKYVQNYRAISLTSFVGKIMKTLVRDSLLDYFLSHHLLSLSQHNFLSGRCTAVLSC